MKDLERILATVLKRVSESRNNSEGGHFALNLHDELKKTISQYVLKACDKREIELMDKIYKEHVKNMPRYQKLKKGLENE